nr:replication factor A protein 1-like isoform X2 [Ipomoea batatas]
MLIDFVIEDSRGSRLTVTLWEEHMDSILPYYNVDLVEPLIVILQLCRAWVNKDGDVRISSSYTATKILFNCECPEFLNFKERFLTPIRSISSSSRMIGSGSLEALSSVTITSLKEIYDNKKDGHLLLWDNVCSILLGVTASELLKKYSEDGCMPNEIEDLVGKTMMFRIVTRKEQFKYSANAAFTVLGVKKDESIIQTHQVKLLNKGDEGTMVRELGDETQLNDNLEQVCPH